MLRYLSYLFIGVGVFAVSCYKDKGNYSYNVPPAPVVSHLDTVYKAIIGDTLLIQPTVTIAQAKPNLGYEWRIGVPEQQTDLLYYGPVVKFIFGLKPQRYSARLTIIDSSNGLKYFYPFFIDGVTIYSKGTTVLSLESGVSQLSFILPDGTVQARVYKNINHEDLPGGPRQVINLVNQNYGGITTGYWIIGSQTDNPGVEIDPNTFQKTTTMRNNFFSAPASIVPGYCQNIYTGTLNGVINGKLYVGASQTYYLSPVYGQFGSPASGDYNLYQQAIFNPTFPYFLGYDSVRKQVVGFTNFGAAAYIGTGYQSTTTAPFDPANVGLDLLEFEQINSQNCYAFGKAADGTIQEIKFSVAFIGIIQVSPQYKRPFPRPELIAASTKWTSGPTEVFFFNNGSTIYRYNPLNQEVKALTTDFGGKTVTMIKITNGGNTLLAGVDGSLYYLDVSAGKFGDILSKIDGIPGAPVDVAQRN
jgi:hypothetical protein